MRSWRGRREKSTHASRVTRRRRRRRRARLLVVCLLLKRGEFTWAGRSPGDGSPLAARLNGPGPGNRRLPVFFARAFNFRAVGAILTLGAPFQKGPPFSNCRPFTRPSQEGVPRPARPHTGRRRSEVRFYARSNFQFASAIYSVRADRGGRRFEWTARGTDFHRA